MSTDLVSILAVVTGLLVVGEAVALWIGVVVLNPDSPWVTKSVRTLLVMDIVSGAALLASVDSPILLVPAATVILGTHAYRVWEVLAGKPERFCFNPALFVFNNIKLLGTVGMIVLLVLSV